MKRIIALILVFAMCLSFAACRKENSEKVMKKDIVGEWMAVAVNAAAVFNEDGTGELTYNGKHTATWTYDPDQDRYIIHADKIYTVTVGKEYDMPYMCLDGVDFYNPDDYGNAHSLLISKRFEDITFATESMIKIETGKSYDILNGVAIDFMQIERDGAALKISYMLTNNRTDAVSEQISLKLKGRYFLANHTSAVISEKNTVLASTLGAAEGTTGSFTFQLGEDPKATMDAFSMVIGVICFEMNGNAYYIDLGNWFVKEN